MTEQNPIREDRMDDINPNEIGVNHPAKDRKAQEKVDIKESGIGRETSQTPADEHIEPSISQIDEGTIKMQLDKDLGKPLESDSDEAEGRDDAGYIADIESPDNKDDSN